MQQNDYILGRNIRIKKIQITPQTNIKPDHTFHTQTQTLKYTRKNRHTDTRKYGDGVYWEIFIKIKFFFFGFLKIPASGAEIF